MDARLPQEGIDMTIAASSPTHRSPAGMRLLPLGFAASLLHALMLVPGYSQDDGFEPGEWGGMLAVSLVVAGIVFLAVVPRGGPRTAVVLGALALLAGVVAFWAALAFPLAAAAIAVGRRTGPDGQRPRAASVGLGLGALAVVATVGITIWDALANY